MVKVWDLFIRLFHWSLVIAIIVQWLTAESFMGVHVWIGYGIALLLTARVAWGFIGSKHARFGDFLYSPRQILGYLESILRRKPKHYRGHNPLGGLMVFLLLLVLILTVAAGLKTLGAKGYGPLADLGPVHLSMAYADEEGFEDDEDRREDAAGNGSAEYWKEIHETLAGTVIFLAVIHVSGVIAASFLHREDLIRAMITGKKPAGTMEGR